MDTDIKVLVLHILIGFVLVYQATEARNVSYCEQYTSTYVNVTNPDSNTIVTRTESDGDSVDSYYSPNLYCSWSLYAAPGKRTYVKVVQYDLKDIPDGEDCYDHTYIAIKQDDIQDDYNWLEADPGVYFRICGTLVPPEFSSADNNVIIEFSSNPNTEQHRGVEFMATEFADGVCPPGWSEVNNICYKLFTNTETWNVAQEFCTLVQSNVASIESNAEAEAINDLIASSENITANDWVWLGLVHPKGTDNSEWIDDTDTAFNLSSKWPEADPGVSENQDIHRCFAVCANGMRTFQPCHDSNNRYAYICKAKKDGSTQLYAASFGSSEETTTSGNTASNMCLNLFLLLMLATLLLTRSLK